jgi:hypothetical protein
VTGGWRRALTAFAVAGLAMAGAPLTARAADCAGVTVVVDFRSLGGGVQTGCAPGDPSSGTAALTAAGFGYTVAARQPGFVCRINDRPSSDPCVTTSPTTAYWSDWHARPGGSWLYGDTSASAHDPAPGSVEGWSFGAGEQPGTAPPAPAPEPTPPAVRPPAPQPGLPAPQPGQPGQPAQPGQPTRQEAGQPTPPPEAPTTTTTAGTTTAPTSPPSTSATASGSATAPTSATPVAVEPTATTSSGGTVGPVVGIAVIAVLAALGVWTARRRAKAAE